MGLTKVKNLLDITADTMADLMTMEHKEGSVQLLGFHERGDGGGGVFFWDDSKSQSEHNGGTIIAGDAVLGAWDTAGQEAWFTAPSTGTGCWVREYSGAVNVKWFGAKGDETHTPTFGLEPKGTDNTNPFKQVFENINATSVYIPGGKYLITDTITPTRMDIKGDNAVIIFETLDKTKPAFIAQSQTDRTWSDINFQGVSYLPLAGIEFKKPDNQAMTLQNIKATTCRHGFYGETGEQLNRVVFSNCNATSNMIAGFWCKSFDTVYEHSAPVFFYNTILNGNGIPTWLTSDTYKGVTVKGPGDLWGVQFYYKGVSTLNFKGGQISDHSANSLLAHVLVEQSNGVTFEDMDFEDLQNPVKEDGTAIADPGSSVENLGYREGGAMTFVAVADVAVKFKHVVGINQQSLVRFSYTCSNVSLELPSSSKMSTCKYSVDYFGAGSNDTVFSFIGNTGNVSPKVLTHTNKANLPLILTSANKNGTYYLPVEAQGIHFDTPYVVDTGTRYGLPELGAPDPFSVPSNYLIAPVSGETMLGVTIIAKNLGYDVDGRFYISFYDESGNYLDSSTASLRPTENLENSIGILSEVFEVPNTSTEIRCGFLNSSNFIGRIPDHGAPIGFSVYSLSPTTRSSLQIQRSVVV